MSERRLLAWSLFGIFLLFLAWSAWPGDILFTALPSILKKGVQFLESGHLMKDALASLFRVTAGVLVGIAITLCFAAALYTSRPAGYAILGITELIRPVPPIGWTPVAILLLGIGDAPAIAVVAVGATAPLWLSLHAGLTQVRDEHVKAARSLGADPIAVVRRVIVPSVLPYFMSGVSAG
jgi:ABC-type nitrate/sulfonate/bicarbonate transport system permease component